MAKTTSKSSKTYKGKSGTKYAKNSHLYVLKKEVEMKELTTSVTGSVTSNGYIIGLNNLNNGNESGQRIGRTVQNVRLNYKFVLLGASASGLIDYLRVMIIHDSAGNGAYPAVGDFLETSAGGSIVTCPKNTRSYPKRFTFLMDKIISVQNQSTGGSCNGDKEDQQQAGSIALSRYGVTRYTGTTSTVPPASGTIFLYVTSYQNTGLVTTSAGLYGHFKYLFTDE